MSSSSRCLTWLLAVVAGGALAVGCDGQAAGSAESHLEAAIVPDADFLVRVDFQSIAATSACKGFGKQEASDEASGEDDATDEEPESGEPEPLDFERFLEVTGLGPGDAVALLVAGDVDGLDLEAEGGPDLSDAVGTLAVQIAKPLGSGKLGEGLEAAAEGRPTTIEKLDLDGHPAFVIRTEKEDDEDVYVASAPGETTLLAAPNAESLRGALARAQEGAYAEVPAALDTVRQALPQGAQAQLAFLAPQKLRDAIQTQLAEAQEDPQAAMTVGFIKPFENLQSISFGAMCGEELQLNLAADLGGAEAANEVSTLLKTMVLPMAKGAIAETLKRSPAELDDRFDVSSEGPALKIGVRMSGDDVTALREKREEAAAGADPEAPESE
jgi:hypothetical protein